MTSVVTNTGDGTAVVVVYTGPRGADGAPGERGPKGDRGEPGSSPRILSGVTVYNASGDWQYIDFPAGIFTATPRIVGVIGSTAGAHSGSTIRLLATSPTRAQFHISNVSGTVLNGVPLTWIAHQP